MTQSSKKPFARLGKRAALLDALLAEEGLTSSSAPQRITRRATTGPVPMSFAQQRLWVIDRLDPGNPSYNIALPLRWSGPLDVDTLRRALGEIMARHAVLRTTFTEIDGNPFQVIAPALELPLPLVDLLPLAPAEREAELARQIRAEAQHSFDLVRGPLFRATLVRLEPDDHVVLLNMHHIISDGWSCGIIIQELIALYSAYAAGLPAGLPELPIQYADYALWQRERLQGEALEAQLGYWRQRLANLPVLELPTDRPRPPRRSSLGANALLSLPKSLGDDLNALSKEEGATLFMTGVAAFAALLHRYSGQSDIVIGTPIAGRHQTELTSMVGFFINMLVLRIDLTGNPTFRALLRQVRDMMMEANANQDVPFEKLVESLQPARDPSRTPLFQVGFSVQQTARIAGPPEVTIDALNVTSGTAKFDLGVLMDERPDELRVTMDYSTDLFEADTISRLLGYYGTLLEAIAANPDQDVAGLPILTAAQREQALLAWCGSTAAYPDDQTIDELVAAWARRTPDAVALVFDTTNDQRPTTNDEGQRTQNSSLVTQNSKLKTQHLTYAELDRRANQLARHLQTLGVGPEVRVGLCTVRSFEQVIGLLGILKAGGAYVPLDPAYPAERITFMLEDSQAQVLITTNDQRPPTNEARSFVLGRSSVVEVDLVRDWPMIARQPATPPESGATPDNLAYIIYTSGSTGTPKGVLIPHRGVCSVISASIALFGTTRDSHILQVASLSFDASVLEMFLGLMSGAKVCLVPPAVLGSPAALGQLLDNQAISLMAVSPSLLEVLPPSPYPALRTIIVGGERCPVETARRWAQGRAFYNAYAPTEATIYATAWKIGGDEMRGLPIGLPIANAQAYVLDRRLEPALCGSVGEVYLGGVGLARGYHNRPDVTAERFIPNPFATADDRRPTTDDEQAATDGGRRSVVGGRLYRTGDLARYRPDGVLEFVGRADDQVKLRGYRIELGEIETVLSRHPAVREVAVLAREDAPGDARLVAYIVTSDELQVISVAASSLVTHNSSLAAELRDHLKRTLPDYMVPSAFVLLGALPLTANGKLDRRALPAPDTGAGQRREQFVAPRDAVELRLARVWESLLNIRPVGLKDNFFALGGHSLLAMRLMAQIQKEFDQRLPLSTLFQAGTVEHLATLLRQQRDGAAYSPLVRLQEGSRRPLFCVHPIGGNVMCYVELARQLGDAQPLYGLQAPGLDGDEHSFAGLEDLAAYYVDAVRAAQPEGPYQLGGWSFGGLVAFEMAQQLRRQGQEVALLALIDSYPQIDDGSGDDADDSVYVAAFAADLRGVFGLPVGDDELAALAPEARVQRVVELAQRAGALPPDADLAQIERLRTVFTTNARLARRYRPQVYPGSAILLRASERPGLEGTDPLAGWDALAAGGVELRMVPGNHYTVLRAPQVQSLAAALAGRLAE